MKVIIEGGLSTKNSPIYTMDSFKLANLNKNIDGIKIDVYLTNDNKIVLLNEEVMKKTDITKEYIYNNPLSKIENINIGTKIKRNKIVSMDELLQTYVDKYIIVNLKETYNNYRNSILVKRVLDCVKNNSSIKWFLTSKSFDILNLILQQNIDVMVGKIIDNPNDINYSFDFYMVDSNNINLISNKTNSIVVVYDINSKEKYRIMDKHNNSFKDLFVIVNNYNLVDNNYLK